MHDDPDLERRLDPAANRRILSLNDVANEKSARTNWLSEEKGHLGRRGHLAPRHRGKFLVAFFRDQLARLTLNQESRARASRSEARARDSSELVRIKIRVVDVDSAVRLSDQDHLSEVVQVHSDEFRELEVEANPSPRCEPGTHHLLSICSTD